MANGRKSRRILSNLTTELSEKEEPNITNPYNYVSETSIP